MKNDFLKELGYSGLTARLKRLSDSMLYSAKDFYKSENVNIEPNWHLVFLILKKHTKRTMTEIADAFHLSQPAVVKIINKMKAKGYIDVIKDIDDNRKQQLKLSQKAINELPQFENYWQAAHNSIEDALKDNDEFLVLLEKLEDKMDNKNLKERTLSQLNR